MWLHLCIQSEYNFQCGMQGFSDAFQIMGALWLIPNVFHVNFTPYSAYIICEGGNFLLWLLAGKTKWKYSPFCSASSLRNTVCLHVCFLTCVKRNKTLQNSITNLWTAFNSENSHFSIYKWPCSFCIEIYLTWGTTQTKISLRHSKWLFQVKVFVVHYCWS